MDKKTAVDVLQIKHLTADSKCPTRADAGSAGYDLYANYDTKVPARGMAIIKTGIAITVPDGCYGRIASRSGLSALHSLFVGAGVIDRSYTGEICVIIFNHSDADYEIFKYHRIAQLIIEQIKTPDIVVVDMLENTPRGDGGFGSSGK